MINQFTEKMRHKKVYLPSGTQVICPNCKILIGKLDNDLYVGESLKNVSILDLKYQMKQFGDRALCGRCGSIYAKNNIILYSKI